MSRFSPARRLLLALVAIFDVIEVSLLISRGLQHHNVLALALGVAVLLVLLGFELAEHAAMKRDEELSREISEWLLPHTSPHFPGVEVAFSNRMANHVGSDYFNVFSRWTRAAAASQSSSIFIVMADVAGSGLQGALLMATFQASLRVLADARLQLRDLASEMNEWCWDRGLEGRHFTMAFLADLDPATGELEYVSAGHQPPVLLRTQGGIERLEAGGFPLGIRPDSLYETGKVRLEPLDTLVIFSDGVVKAENRLRDQFAEDRVLRALERSRGSSAPETLNRLTTSMLAFCGAARQPDDHTLMVVRRQSDL
jgi:phosphoserine phosphatase RsbU/P